MGRTVYRTGESIKEMEIKKLIRSLTKGAKNEQLDRSAG